MTKYYNQQDSIDYMKQYFYIFSKYITVHDHSLIQVQLEKRTVNASLFKRNKTSSVKIFPTSLQFIIVLQYIERHMPNCFRLDAKQLGNYNGDVINQVIHVNKRNFPTPLVFCYIESKFIYLFNYLFYLQYLLRFVTVYY